MRGRGHRFEVIQKFSDAPIDTCRVCGSPVHKLQSAPAFHLKGTGWYATDYAKSGSTAESKGGKDSHKDGEDGKTAEGSEAELVRPARSRPPRPTPRPAASTPPAAKPDTPKS